MLRQMIVDYGYCTAKQLCVVGPQSNHIALSVQNVTDINTSTFDGRQEGNRGQMRSPLIPGRCDPIGACDSRQLLLAQLQSLTLVTQTLSYAFEVHKNLLNTSQ